MPESLNNHQKNLKWIGHRGFQADNPENTLEAFKKVIENPNIEIAGIELDVQISKDEKILVFHDDTLKRFTGNKSKISQLDYSQIQKLMSVSGGIQGHNIPLLKDVLNITNHKKKLLIEIKSSTSNYSLLVREIANLMNFYQPNYDVILHSFSDVIMEKIIASTKHLNVYYGFLFVSIRKLKKLKRLKTDVFEKLDYIHPHFRTLNWRNRSIRKMNKKINTWTVNSIGIVKKIMKLKSAPLMEFIMTDYTDLMDKYNGFVRGKK